MARTVLIIDDERNMRWVLERALTKAGYDVVTAERGEQGIRQFSLHAIDLVLLDLKMPGMDGMVVLRELRRRDTRVPILLLTAYATVPTAVEALRIGANDYLRKPFDLETVLAAINRQIADASDAQMINELAPSIPQPFVEFIGADSALDMALAYARSAQQSPYPVILRGEQGVGKRHLARLIHNRSLATCDKRLVELDCATLPPPALAYELLAEPSSTERGGSWHHALGGTLLLANVDALPDKMVNQTVELLGSHLLSSERPHGLRLLITTAAPLADAWQPVAAFAFDIALPSLRARIADLPLLLAHFAPGVGWDRQVLAAFRAYDWPGNVAEFQRVVQQAVYLSGEAQVTTAHLPAHILDMDNELAGIFVLPPEGISLDEVEEDLIRQALEKTGGNKAQAARLLGLSRATLLYRIDKYNLLPPETKVAGVNEEKR